MLRRGTSCSRMRPISFKSASPARRNIRRTNECMLCHRGMITPQRTKASRLSSSQSVISVDHRPPPVVLFTTPHQLVRQGAGTSYPA